MSEPPFALTEIGLELGALVDDLIDERVSDLRARVAAGYALTQGETLALIDQLVKDRARKRLLHERLGAPLQ